jgi:hypothetical protein
LKLPLFRGTSERTKIPALALKELGFFPQITTQNYCSVLAIGCDFVRNGQEGKIVRALALIEHHDRQKSCLEARLRVQ